MIYARRTDIAASKGMGAQDLEPRRCLRVNASWNFLGSDHSLRLGAHTLPLQATTIPKCACILYVYICMCVCVFV